MPKVERYMLVLKIKIAEFFKDLGLIEKYGSGIGRIIGHFKQENLPLPKFENISDGLQVTVYPTDMENDAEQANTQVREQVREQVEKLLFIFEDGNHNMYDLMSKLNLKSRYKFSLNYIQPALKLGLIEMTIPDKPNSRLQKYRLTEKGKELKNKIE